jgi:hypothetical protein
VNEALRQALGLQAVFLGARIKKNERKNIMGEPIAPNWVKGSKTIGILQLWRARQLPG